MKITSLFLSALLVATVAHAYEPMDEQSYHQTNPQSVKPAAPDTTVAPVAPAASSLNPVTTRILGWGLATTGLVMAASGIGLLGDNDGCALIQGFSCDRDRQQQQFLLIGGGALIGSIGAVLIWGADGSLGQAPKRDTLSAGTSPAALQSPKNMAVGMGLGLAGSVVGTLLIWNEPSVASGMLGILAPGLGQAYAGTIYGTATAMSVRALGGFMLAKNYMDCKYGDECDRNYTTGKAIFVTGVAISLYDIWSSIRRSEGHARAASASTFALAPALFPVGEGRLVPGLAFHTSF